MSKAPENVIRVALRDILSGKPIPILPGRLNKIVVVRPNVTVDILEAEDALFRNESAFFLPSALQEQNLDPDDKSKDSETLKKQIRVSGLDVLAAFFDYYARCIGCQSPKRVLISGHTDTVGSDAYNETLSRKRANVVLYMILGNGADRIPAIEADPETPLDTEGNRSEFVDIVSSTHTEKDQQHVLKWTAQTLSWGQADPGEIDGVIGQQTRLAIQAFKKNFKDSLPIQTRYANVRFTPDINTIRGKLDDSSRFTDLVWAAIFELYQAELELALQKRGLDLDRLRSELSWVAPEKKAVGCGETWPREARGVQNYKSQTNRRVEILLYDPGEILAELPCKDQKCVKDDCHIFADIKRPEDKKAALRPRLSWRYLPRVDEEVGPYYDLYVRFDANTQLVSDQTKTYELYSLDNLALVSALSTGSDIEIDGDGCYLDFPYLLAGYTYSLVCKDDTTQVGTIVFDRFRLRGNTIFHPDPPGGGSPDWNTIENTNHACLLAQRERQQ